MFGVSRLGLFYEQHDHWALTLASCPLLASKVGLANLGYEPSDLRSSAADRCHRQAQRSRRPAGATALFAQAQILFLEAAFLAALSLLVLHGCCRALLPCPPGL